jgi:hypothetical protein
LQGLFFVILSKGCELEVRCSGISVLVVAEVVSQCGDSTSTLRLQNGFLTGCKLGVNASNQASRCLSFAMNSYLSHCSYAWSMSDL